jgi:hypothetical protein
MLYYERDRIGRLPVERGLDPLVVQARRSSSNRFGWIALTPKAAISL